MSPSTSFQESDRVKYFSRKFLLHNPLAHDHQPAAILAPAPDNNDNNGFDSHIIMIMGVLLSAAICSILLNFIIKYVLRCSGFVASGEDQLAKKIDQGVEKQTLETFTIVKYNSDELSISSTRECVICITEFVCGDKVRILPNCNHGFHVKCIDKWLNSHTSCPTCRQSMIIENSCHPTSPGSELVLVPVVEVIIVEIAPLEEGPIR